MGKKDKERECGGLRDVIKLLCKAQSFIGHYSEKGTCQVVYMIPSKRKEDRKEQDRLRSDCTRFK